MKKSVLMPPYVFVGKRLLDMIHVCWPKRNYIPLVHKDRSTSHQHRRQMELSIILYPRVILLWSFVKKIQSVGKYLIESLNLYNLMILILNVWIVSYSSRLEIFEQSCAVDSVTKKCAGKVTSCRMALLGVMGTTLRTLCACQGSDVQQLYKCLGWQRLLWLNPCVGEWTIWDLSKNIHGLSHST
jgi:GDNF/GAS1 domain